MSRDLTGPTRHERRQITFTSRGGDSTPRGDCRSRDQAKRMLRYRSVPIASSYYLALRARPSGGDLSGRGFAIEGESTARAIWVLGRQVVDDDVAEALGEALGKSEM